MSNASSKAGFNFYPANIKLRNFIANNLFYKNNFIFLTFGGS